MPTTGEIIPLNAEQLKIKLAEERLMDELKDIPISYYVRICFGEFGELEQRNTIAYLQFVLKRV